jgi:hypothetical protein
MTKYCRTSEFRIRRARKSVAMVAAYDGRNLLGHIFDRGADGYEAVDRDGTRLGFFSDQRAALDAFDALVVGEDEPPF